MREETLQNIIDSMVLDWLHDYYYMSTEKLTDIFEIHCECYNDLEEITELALNSKRYNTISLQSGESYIISQNKNDFRTFFEDVEISDSDIIWLCYVYCDNKSIMLRDLYEEVM